MTIMQNGESHTSEALPSLPSEGLTKQSYRLKVWNELEKNGFAAFPRPVNNRIPNFKGAIEAAQKLCQLDVFKNAKNIKVNIDKPQEFVRLATLEAGKTLFVPNLTLKESVMKQIIIPDCNMATLKKACCKAGSITYGQNIDLNDNVSLDLVVLGCIAVSKNGYRIGKRQDYSSMEFGVLTHTKAINPNTLVVTTVHDCQVFDTLPEELFEPHDVLIDLIITPTQVIETKKSQSCLNRPSGIIWGLLSNRKLGILSILRELRDKEMLAGFPCVLKAEDTDTEELSRRAVRDRPRRPRRYIRRYKTNSESERNEVSDSQANGRRPSRRPRRRLDVAANKSTAASEDPSGDGIVAPDTTTVRSKKFKLPKSIIFSVKVSNIEKSARVCDLKTALRERGIKPQRMSWKGFRGYCYLHFTKTATQLGDGDANHSAESVCEALSNLCLVPTAVEPDVTAPAEATVVNMLVVEPAKFPSKVQSANATAEPVNFMANVEGADLTVEPANFTTKIESSDLTMEPANFTAKSESDNSTLEPANFTVKIESSDLTMEPASFMPKIGSSDLTTEPVMFPTKIESTNITAV